MQSLVGVDVVANSGPENQTNVVKSDAIVVKSEGGGRGAENGEIAVEEVGPGKVENERHDGWSADVRGDVWRSQKGRTGAGHLES
jgi:hypothetical protein